MLSGGPGGPGGPPLFSSAAASSSPTPLISALLLTIPLAWNVESSLSGIWDLSVSRSEKAGEAELRRALFRRGGRVRFLEGGGGEGEVEDNRGEGGGGGAPG